MSVQDRNIHRDARALRKSITIPFIVPAFGTNQDEPQFLTQPRYNWRLSDLEVQVLSLATADLIVKAQAVPFAAALGSPQLSPAAAVTFGIEEFWKKRDDRNQIRNVGPIAAQAFTEVFTVLDGFWGVALVVIDTSDAVGVIANSPIQAFATEEIALANCPKPRPFAASDGDVGRVAILTINAVGGDFIAGTTNTDAALVAAFNTAPQDGHVATMTPNNSPRSFQSVLGQQLRDASGTDILQGIGGFDNPGVGGAGTSLALSVRTAGAPVLTGGIAVVEYRPWPAGGEGVGDASVSQNRPSFVP